MKFATYIINLDQAEDRMRMMDEQLCALDIPYLRIGAVFGESLAEPIQDFDDIGFKLRTGKHPIKGQIGCYFSHIQALRLFLDSDHQHALILEDDAKLPGDLIETLESAMRKSEQWDLLRLSSSRQGSHIEVGKLGDEKILAISTSVVKNTAACMFNRVAAQACLKHMLPMKWPYDVALDRDWAMGVRTACVRPFPVTMTGMPSQIPVARRLRWLRSTTFHVFHTLNHFKRILYRQKIAKEMMRGS